jgi:putative acetyltransferase
MVALWLAASRTAHSFVPYEFWSSQADDMREIYLPGSETYVACGEDGAVLGFVSLSANHLAALFVDPVHQGRGIGRALLEHAQSLRQFLTLAVYVRNARAAAFYERNGFVAAHERVDERTGEPEMVMEWARTV